MAPTFGSATGACAGERGGTCGCAEGGDRREFLRDVTMIVASALAAAGLTAEDAAAYPVTFLAGVPAGAEQAYPIPPSDGVTIDRDNQVILARFQNRACAFALACPHQNTALRWLSTENRFQCPRHESKYRPGGEFMSGRATRNMDRFAIQRSGNRLLVDLDRLFRSDIQNAEWAAAIVPVG